MPTPILLATRNAHKAAEIAAMVKGLDFQWKSLRDFPEIEEVEEDGSTLEENAAKKALLPARESGLWAMADDTGLEVDALAGAPGVRSARYAGPGADYEANNSKLLSALEGTRERSARFRCVIALASPAGQVVMEQGSIEGVIAAAPRGRSGFGYDPLFLLPSLGKTLAELSPEEKNRLSHRALALGRMRPHLERLAAGDEGKNGRHSSQCPRCGLAMDPWHCRELCPGCGYQIDCSD